MLLLSKWLLYNNNDFIDIQIITEEFLYNRQPHHSIGTTSEFVLLCGIKSEVYFPNT